MNAAGDKPRDMRDVREQQRAVRMRDFRHALEIDDARVGGRADRDQLRAFPRRHFRDFVVIDVAVFADAVMNDLIQFPGEIHGSAVREMPAVREIHRQNFVARLQRGEINRHVRLRARMRLHVGVLGAEKFLRAVNRDLLDFVDPFAAAVPAFFRIALGVLVRQHAALSRHHGGQREVFGRDQFDVRLLSFEFALDAGGDFRIEVGERC